MKTRKQAAFFVTAVLSAAVLAGCSGQKTAAEDAADAENYDTGDASLDNARNQDDIGGSELLVVSFGTSYNDSRRLTVGAIEDAIEKAFPDFSVRRGFTSQIIIDHVKSRDKISMDNVGEALGRAAENGVKKLVVQPTHLMNGLEYTDLVNEVAEYSDAFEQVAVGEPLLTSDGDFKAVMEAITKATAKYDDGETAVCFMGHGTEAESNRVYAKMQEMLTAAGYENYFVGTVEATPGLEDVLAAVQAGQYKKVVLEPLMIVAGDHANNDMAGDEDGSWKTAFEGAGYDVTCLVNGLGELEEIRQLFVEHAQAAVDSLAAAETVSPAAVVKGGMEPVYGSGLKDGVYPVKVDSSSSMFRITACELTVADGEMSAVMTMGGTGYLKLYMGTGEEAKKASEAEYIPYVESGGGTHTFEVPVKALDMGIDCSAFSRNKQSWYDRVLVFRSDSLPMDAFAEGEITTAESLGLADGEYTAAVILEGGSGRAAVESPARFRVENGKVFATVVWGSANYDYMKVDGEKFDLLSAEGNSAFEIPVSGFDRRIAVIADTIAMSEPHEVEYSLTFDSATIKKAGFGETGAVEKKTGPVKSGAAENRSRVTPARSMDLSYATQFSVDYYDGGYVLITVRDSGRYLLAPERKTAPGDLPENQAEDRLRDLPEDVTVIRRPVKNMYLAATSAMDFFKSLDAVDRITLSGTDASGWYIGEARQAMEEGRMAYAGKYNAPDYELILSKNCGLAVESTMIYHSPEVKEQLEKLGIPVLVERSSYEEHPLGRMEWVKLYGALLGKEEQADALFEEQKQKLETLAGQKTAGKTVAFFYVTSNGYVNVRKPGEYVAKMIELAGGSYVPGAPVENENALSTMNMQMEAFYAAAKDADYMIYNSAIDGELKGLDELLAKSGLLADFKAVKEGHVWCTGKNMFQETMGLGGMIQDIHKILTEENPDPDEMEYLYPLR